MRCVLVCELLVIGGKTIVKLTAARALEPPVGVGFGFAGATRGTPDVPPPPLHAATANAKVAAARIAPAMRMTRDLIVWN
jgi:hypothetical protein